MSRSILKTIFWITVFAAAMGFLETAVVIYLRELYYPAGFEFPLQPMTSRILFTEILREAATVVMLAGAGILAGRTNTSRFAFFIYAFAVWDLFFYLFLEILIGWPASLLTWDLLFMIPVPWVGPVIAPVMNAVSMILLALLLICATEKDGKTALKWLEWSLLVLGSLIVIISYTEDYLGYMLRFYSLTDLLNYRQHPGVASHAAQYIPLKFSWFLWLAGEGIILYAILRLFLRTRKLITLPRHS